MNSSDKERVINAFLGLGQIRQTLIAHSWVAFITWLIAVFPHLVIIANEVWKIIQITFGKD